MPVRKRRLDEEIDAFLGDEQPSGDLNSEIDAFLSEPTEAPKPEPSLAESIQSGLESVITPVAREAWGVLKPPDVITQGIGEAFSAAYRPVSALGAYGAAKLQGKPEQAAMIEAGREIVGGEGAKGTGLAPAAKQVMDAAVEWGVKAGVVEKGKDYGKPVKITVPPGVPYAGGKTVEIPPEYFLSVPAELALPVDLGLTKAIRGVKGVKAVRAAEQAAMAEEATQRIARITKRSVPAVIPKAEELSGDVGRLEELQQRASRSRQMPGEVRQQRLLPAPDAGVVKEEAELAEDLAGRFERMTPEEPTAAQLGLSTKGKMYLQELEEAEKIDPALRSIEEKANIKRLKGLIARDKTLVAATSGKSRLAELEAIPARSAEQQSELALLRRGEPPARPPTPEPSAIRTSDQETLVDILRKDPALRGAHERVWLKSRGVDPSARYEDVYRPSVPEKAIETPVEATTEAPPVSGADQPPIVPEAPIVSGVEAAGEAAGKAKEPWEMTRDERIAFEKQREADTVAEMEATLAAGTYPRSERVINGTKLLDENEARTAYEEAIERAKKQKPDWWYEEDIASTKPLPGGGSSRHVQEIERAYRAGETIPPEVLESHPGLAEQLAVPRAPEAAVSAPGTTISGTAGKETAEAATPAYGASNRLVSTDAADAARARLKAKEGSTLMGSAGGFDPAYIKDIAILGTYHLEAGAREFGAWSAKMVSELGERVRPYLRQVWDEVQAQQAPPAAKAAKAAPRAGAGVAAAQTPPGAPVPPGGLSASEQVAERIQFRQEKPARKSVKEWLRTKEINVIDDVARMRQAKADLAGGAVNALEDPHLLARISRGWVGKAESWIDDGAFHFMKASDRFTDAEPLSRIIEEAGDPERFSKYLTAKRAQELENLGYTTGFEGIDKAQAIRELETPQMLAAEAKFRKVRDAFLDYLEEAGLVSSEGKAELLKTHAYYVPFQRVLEKEGGAYTDLSRRFADLPSAIKKLSGSERIVINPLESFVKNIYAGISLAERNNAGRALAALAEASPDGASWMSRVKPGVHVPAGTKVVHIWEGGQRTPWAVADEQLYNSLKALDREEANSWVKLVSKISALKRTGITLAPEFGARNIIRDVLGAMVQTQTGSGWTMPIDVIRALGSVGRKDELYRLWKASGGEQAFLVSIDEAFNKMPALKKLMEGKPSNLKIAGRIARHPVDALRAISKFSETPTRLAEFSRQVRRGGVGAENLAKAAKYSRDVTVDFSVAGAKVQALRLMTAFWNPAIQGTRTTVERLAGRPGVSMARIAGMMTVPSVMLYLANRQDGRYWDIPMWQRNAFWIVPSGFVSVADWQAMSPAEKADFNAKHTIWRIPKANAYGALFGSLPERVLEYADAKAPDVIKNIQQALAPDLLPVPDFARPGIENFANRDIFTGRRQIPGRLEEAAPEAQYTSSTSELAKALGKLTGHKMPTAKSPIDIENYITEWTGTLGKQGLQLTDALANLGKKGEAPDWSSADIPGLKGFVVRQPTAQSESLQTLYDLASDLTGQHKKYQLHPEQLSSPEAGLNEAGYSLIDPALDQLSELRKMSQTIRDNPNMSGAEKREKLDEITFAMQDYARRILDAYYSIKGQANAPR